MKRTFQTTVILTAVILAAVLEGRCALAVYGFPEETWHVSSKYTNPITGHVSNTVFWEYSAMSGKDSTVNVEVADKFDQVAESAKLVFNSERRLVRAEKTQRIQSREVKKSIGLSAFLPAVLDELLVPGNWLNGQAPNAGETQYFKITRETSRNVTFARKISLTTTTMNGAAAVSAGMIDDSVADLLDGTSLILVTCREIPAKGGEKVLFEQLWHPNLSFWLYEKTPTRESWFTRE